MLSFSDKQRNRRFQYLNNELSHNFHETESGPTVGNTDGPDLHLPVPEPHLISQGELNDLVRDLNMTKSMSELLCS